MKLVQVKLTQPQLETIIEAVEAIDVHAKDFTTEQYMHYAMTIDKLDQALDFFKEAEDE